jgi:hypothetical protein
VAGYGKASDRIEVIMIHSLHRKGKDQRGWMDVFALRVFGSMSVFLLEKGTYTRGSKSSRAELLAPKKTRI